MIQYLPHSKIDKLRWDNTINQAQKNCIYGYSWYLDIVSPDWDALILNDYEAVMPLTRKRKHGIKYLVQPLLTQQLGVFGNNISENTVDLFISSIPIKFKHINIKLNESNNSIEYRHLLQTNINYTLDLSASYESIFHGFSKGLKSHLKKCNSVNITIKSDIEFEGIIDFLELNLLNRLLLNNLEIIRLLNMIYEVCKKKELIRFYTAYIDNELATVVIMLNSFDRWILLISASNKTGKQNNCKSYILDSFIKERAGKSEILDFEGSNLPNIAMYNSGFGALKNHYFSLKANNPNLFKLRKIATAVQISIFGFRI